jgi:glycosyltransferase involved in cell wall biosynthesis
MQLWHPGHLERLSRAALRVVFSLFDVISLRSHYLDQEEKHITLRDALTLSDKVVSISDYSAADARDLFGLPVDARTIYLGFETHRSDALGPIRKGSVLLVGNHYFHKALAEAVHVLAGHPDLTVLGGTGNWPGVRFSHPSGSLSEAEIGRLLSESEVHVYPSLYEGFGLPLCHAAALRRWVVAHDNKLNRELVANLGLQNVVFFNNFWDIPACVDRCHGLAPESPTRTWAAVVDDHASLLREVVAEPVNWGLVERRWDYAVRRSNSR